MEIKKIGIKPRQPDYSITVTHKELEELRSILGKANVGLGLYSTVNDFMLGEGL